MGSMCGLGLQATFLSDISRISCKAEIKRLGQPASQPKLLIAKSWGTGRQPAQPPAASRIFQALRCLRPRLRPRREAWRGSESPWEAMSAQGIPCKTRLGNGFPNGTWGGAQFKNAFFFFKLREDFFRKQRKIYKPRPPQYFSE